MEVDPRAALLAQIAATLASQLATPRSAKEARNTAAGAVKMAGVILDLAERYAAGRYIGGNIEDLEA